MKKGPLLCMYLLICLGVAFSTQSNAQVQSVTASSGGYLQGQDVAVSFTLGETTINTLQVPDLMVTQGFQQANLWVTAVDELEGFAINIEAYPNPVTDIINLVVDKELSSEASYSLFDMRGGLVSREKLAGLITKISFQELVPATYLLKVNHGATTAKTFKIIKK